MYAVLALMTLLFLNPGIISAQEGNMPNVADGMEPAVEEPESVMEPSGTETPVTSGFAYQGQLKNNGGRVTGTCDFIWNIFADVSGGTTLATDSDGGVAVVNGLFTALVDVPASVIDGSARYLEIQVRCPAG